MCIEATMFEAGGVVGTLAVGILSDRLGGSGYRNTASLIHSAVLLAPLVALWLAASWQLPSIALVSVLFVAGFAVREEEDNEEGGGVEE